MTHLPAEQLQTIARDAAARFADWTRDDVAGDVVLALVDSNPSDVYQALALAARAANASRMRATRSSRRAAIDGALIGASTDPTMDAAATRILLDAAVRAARTGLDFSSSRVRRRLFENG